MEQPVPGLAQRLPRGPVDLDRRAWVVPRGAQGRHPSYRLTIRDFSEDSLFAHFHFARSDVNGGVIAFLCGGGGTPACPRDGIVTGTITAANVIGPTDRGITAGEFGELIRGCATARRTPTSIRPHTSPARSEGTSRAGTDPSATNGAGRPMGRPALDSR